MDISAAVTGYITKMVTVDEPASGVSSGKMKILLLDEETVPIMSASITKSALSLHEIFLVDRVGNERRQPMRQMHCICFVRPSTETIEALIKELKEPKYREYHIFFSNILKKSHIARLAESDVHEVVRSVQEYFADFIVTNPDFFSLNISPHRLLWSKGPETWNPECLNRSIEGVLSVLLSLKKKPLIRYDKNSLLAKKLASEIRYVMTQEEALFDFRKPDTPPILLVLDRRSDPITPLLTQWTYQAMVHDLIGIQNGIVDLRKDKSKSDSSKELVLARDQDEFFKKNMYLNFGDLGANIKNYVDQFQVRSKSNENIESIEDMKRFVEDYPQFRELSGNVSKHVALVSELSRKVGEHNLLEVSELEQSLACNSSHDSDLKTLQKLLQSHAVPSENKLRLVALYALRYEKQPSNAVNLLLDLLGASTDLQPDEIELIPQLLRYHHSLLKVPESQGLFDATSIFSGGRFGFKGLRGVDNVYTQHSPALETTLQNLIKGRLKEATHPFVEGGGTTKDKAQDIIVFMIGGVTFEEAKLVAQMNVSLPGVRVVLGGTSVHNSNSFLEEVELACRTWPAVPAATAAGRLRQEVGR